jgi:hypothetical protein
MKTSEMPDPCDVFREKITAIKRQTRERQAQHAPQRPLALKSLTHDVDWGCYRWSGSDTLCKPGTKIAMTDLAYRKLRLAEAEYQRDLMQEMCSQRNAVIVELEHLLYTTLDHVPQYQKMGNKLRAIQTILDDGLV